MLACRPPLLVGSAATVEDDTTQGSRQAFLGGQFPSRRIAVGEQQDHSESVITVLLPKGINALLRIFAVSAQNDPHISQVTVGESKKRRLRCPRYGAA